MILSLIPVFPCRSDRLAERGIVWDLWRLMESVRRPDGHSILDCICGYPPHADIEAAVLVSHPDDTTVVWELDLAGLRPALDDAITSEGFIRLVFARDEYEAAVRAMLREVQQAMTMPVPVADLKQAFGYECLLRHYPQLERLPVGLFKPGRHGDCGPDEFAVLDAQAPWPREPLFAPGTVIEIGFFGTELWRVDGRVQHEWIGHWFTRWEALAMFHRWMDAVARRFALKFYGVETAVGGDSNEFVLLPGQDADACHRAGEAFAAALRRCLGEGRTAPGVEVRYVRRDIPAAGAGEEDGL